MDNRPKYGYNLIIEVNYFNKYMTSSVPSWQIVPKPRSAIKTVEWLPAILSIEGGCWNKKDENNEHPIRREYLKLAHPLEDFKDDDPEINARMEFARYQMLGVAYLDKNENDEDAVVKITPAGKILAASNNKEEIMLRQLLKWQFPSNIHSGSRYKEMKIFPLEVIIKVLQKFGVVNRMEIGFSVFTCSSIDEIEKVFEKILIFRKLVNGIPAKNHKEIWLQNFEKYNGKTNASPGSFIGNYDDVLFRYLEYTGIFETSGRGDFTKLYVPEIAKFKFNQLVNNYKFNFFEDYNNKEEFYKYFGDPYANLLPWETKEIMQEMVNEKIKYLETKNKKVEKIKHIKKLSVDDLKSLENSLDNEILSINENDFIKTTSKTKKERDFILQKFNDIDNGNEDLAALWLEVNTWKSLVAMEGSHYVKRNFNIEADLTPRSFAGGRGNTPDMEFYNSKYIIIPEVSIQSGVQQWITEGSSVVDHVYKFSEIKNGKRFYGIDDVEKYINKDNIKAVYGFFLCKKINERLLWQFYILNKAAWRGEPINIVPMEIKEYLTILEYMYKNNISAIEFELLIEQLAKEALSTENYQEWQVRQGEVVNIFINDNKIKNATVN